LDRCIDISADKVVNDIIYCRGHIYLIHESILRERIMRAMCDTHLAWHSGYSYEYEAPQVAELLSKEVFRLHGLHVYIDSDRDNRSLGVFW
jgi:hypothetical protein